MKPGFGKNKNKNKKKKQAKVKTKKNEMEVDGGIEEQQNKQLNNDIVEDDVQMEDTEKPNLKDGLQRKMALKAQIRALKKQRQKVSKIPKKGALRAAMTEQIKDLIQEKETKK